MDYIEKQLYSIAPLPILSGENGQFVVKFKSAKGSTKFMNITNEQLKHIERYLCGIEFIEKGSI